MRTRNSSRRQSFHGWPTKVQVPDGKHFRLGLNLIRRLRFEPLEERRLLALMAGEIGSTDATAVVGEALLSFTPGLSQQEIASFYADHGLSELTDVTSNFESEDSVLKLVSVPLDLTNEGIIALGEDSRVEYAEPNYIVVVDALPDDGLFDQLWGLHNEGQTGGTVDADIDAPEAWDIATGSSQIVVGVIDTGIDYSHPDLYLNMWLNQGEIPSDLVAVLTDTNSDGLITFVDLNDPVNASYTTDLNGSGFVDAADLLTDQNWADGSDTDGNGFVDDFVGWDFVNNDNAPWDDYGHGTHVAGTIGAMSDNGLGVAGVNWDVQIMPVKFLSASGSGSTEAAVQSVYYATNMGANLTNNSWGGGGFSAALYDAIEASGDANMLFIAAAGNDGIDTDVYAHYPSSYDSDNIISVAATDHNDGRAYFSSYGTTTVDLGAPGVSIMSTVPGSQYASNDGTSMATPHVAGVAALAWSINPNASYAEIRDAIFVSADPVASMGGITVTGGRLNAAGTLENVNPHRGSVILDQEAYPLPDMIEIRVNDADLDVDPLQPDTVTVEISSDTETTAELVVLTETGPSTRAFVGTIALATGAASADGTLQAVHGDTVTVVYEDAYDGEGPAIVSDTAVVDNQGPVISQIDATPAAARAVISWTTDEPSDSIVRYGVQPDDLNMTVTETSLTTSHSVALTSLTPQTIYYFQVTSADAAGNATTSENHNFTTLEVSPILFVDDDEGANLQGYFTDALDANEYPYDVWDVSAVGYSPSTSDMSEYQVIVWNTGDEYSFETSGLTADEQASLSGYLDGGGSLFLSGQDVLYNQVSWEFQSNYLHVVAYGNDEEVYRATGVSGDPISDGMDLSLSVPSGYEANYADTLLPDSLAAGIFSATETGFYGGTYQYAATRYPATEPGPFKVVFFAFPFEAISTTAADPNNQVYVMANVIDWLGISAPDRPGIAVSPTSGLETTEAGGTANFSVVLNTQPEFDVVLAVSTSDTSEGLVSVDSDPGPSAQLTFTPDNWDEPQSVTVTGVDDLDEDEHVLFTIVTAAAVSSDPVYHGLDPADVTVTNRDDDRRYPPVLDLDANNSSGATGSDFVATFDAGGIAVAISDVDAVLTDSDSPMLTSLSVVITNVQDVDEELLAADTTGTSISASFDPVTGTLVLSGSDTVSNYQQVLRTVTYDNTLGVPNAADRIITFVANDGEQDSNTATTTVAIEGVNKPPVAEANGDYEIRMGSSLYLSGYGSYDPDYGPSPLTYSWDLDDDGVFDDATGSYRSVTWTTLVSLGYEIGQTYTISLQVSDGLSMGVDTAQVTVLANQVPNANAGGAYTIRSGQNLYLNGNQTFDPDNLPSPLTLRWNLDADDLLGGDPDYDDATGTYLTVSWATLASLGYEMGNTYTIGLEASDGMDAGEATTEVIVLGNQVPVADPGGPYTINMGQRLYLNGNQSYDPDNSPSPLTLRWNLDADVALGSDPEFDDATGTYPSVSWATLANLGYEMGKTYTIALEASDGSDAIVATTQVTVRGNQEPVAKAGGPYTVSAGQTLYLNGSQSFDPDNLPLPLTYSWDLDNNGEFGDSTLVYPYVTWSMLENYGFHAGTNTVALKVDDGDAYHIDYAEVIVTGISQPYLSYGTVSNVGDSDWTTVTLPHAYESMVVIATPNYDETTLAGVTRIRNASGNSFDVRVDGAGGGAVSGVKVHYVVVEEGVYNESGFKMEAVKIDTTHIDRAASWTGELQTYGQTYNTPVVVGQVMTYNDPAFSVFWARGTSRSAPPSSGALYVGRHVGEDPNWASRPTVNETIGYFVIEATLGVGEIEGLPFVAGLGGDTIRGITNSPPYSYSYTAMPNAKAAVASQAGMDGGNGGWAVLYGNDPLPPAGGTLRLAIDEDQLKDTERYHTTEQVAYLIIDPPLLSETSVPLIAESNPLLPIQIVDRETPSFRRPLMEHSQPPFNESAEEVPTQFDVGEAAVAADTVFARLGDRILAGKGGLNTHRAPLLAAGDSDLFESLHFSDQFWRDLSRARR